MKNSKSHLLSSPGFVISILILLLNDFYLKAELHNWFTGKLSDFAGLFAFSLFFLSFFDKSRKLVLTIIGVLFLLWKSHLSEGFIEFWNSFAPFNIARIVDYTDLLALIVLPFANVYAVKERGLSNVKVPKMVAFSVAIFAFMATSQPYDDSFIGVELDFQTNLDTTISETVNRLNSIEDVDISIKQDSDPTVFLGSANILVDGCSGDFFYTFNVVEINENSSTIVVEYVSYSCPEQNYTEAQLTQLFVERVIDKIR